MAYQTFTLDNGLRVIHRPDSSPIVYCGYQINAGTRDEEPGEEGLAHFCEHATFKGTSRRKAWHVLNGLESVGGDLNAFTTKEDTVYYAAILKEHTSRAIDLLTDIVFHSVYPQHELDKEVEVICDEIESYHDSPAELIFDEFENMIFEGHPLGHNILGTATAVRSFTTADALRFTGRHYRPDNAIFFIAGDVDFRKVICQLQRADWSGKGRIARESGSPVARNSPVSPSSPSSLIVNRNTHQAHVMLGCRAYDIHDERRMSLYLLNNMLGGPGMNARLNLALREHHGLVYTVDSTMVSYSDTGLWAVYFGCDPHDVKRCVRLIRRELDKVMEKPLSAVQLGKAKKQLKGQIGVACDNRESFALDFGKSFLHYGWEKDITTLFQNIDAITPENIQQVARELMAPDRLTTLIYQ
ncbi:insulinase family protein [Prevotella sp. A2931]|uniref:Insulinase family protein n=1 Tax=Prevotella illustrans TaxID=2800387 RepID=A0ABS3M2D3_9BACT|nr:MULTISPECIES: pitrilysin family protein [Prevotella]MBO1362347.1 insulinase family protein [Prevotella illustrans]PTL26410.1 peptidase M16 [Prevotella sp. oral taxon 820]